MKLTKKDRELLTEVRNRMYEVYGTEDHKYFEYICWSIVRIGAEQKETPKKHYESLLEYAERVGGSVKRLINAIHEALGRSGTLDNWMTNEYLHKYKDYEAAFAMRRFVAEARLAWLDRILETGEIV